MNNTLSLILFIFQGDEGFEEHIDHLFEMTKYLVDKLKSHPDKFEMVYPEPECVNVCFWYVPFRLRTMESGAERRKQLGPVSKTFIFLIIKLFILIKYGRK